MKLNLGCGFRPRPDYINVDITKHSPHVDEIWDLRVFPWPWADNSVEHIWFKDVLEHLPDVIGTINECWRVLQPGGSLHVSHVHYAFPNLYIDPTHLRGFHEQSFDYFDPTTHWGREYAFYTPYKWKIDKNVIEECNVVVDMHPLK